MSPEITKDRPGIPSPGGRIACFSSKGQATNHVDRLGPTTLP